MNDKLAYLRSLTRERLIQEIRRVTGDDRILLWEQVPYGEFYHRSIAGPITAAQLGVKDGDVIGYIVWSETPKGSAIGDLFNAEPKNTPPDKDPFKDW